MPKLLCAQLALVSCLCCFVCAVDQVIFAFLLSCLCVFLMSSLCTDRYPPVQVGKFDFKQIASTPPPAPRAKPGSVDLGDWDGEVDEDAWLD